MVLIQAIMVSYTSNISQKDVGNYSGLHSLLPGDWDSIAVSVRTASHITVGPPGRAIRLPRGPR